MKGFPKQATNAMKQGKLGSQLKSFKNDLRNAKDDETKRKIRLDIQSTMEEMQAAGMSTDQIKNIGGKSPFEKEGLKALYPNPPKEGLKARTLQGPKTTRSEAGKEFDKAFAKARKEGKGTFTWKGKLYNTKLA